MAGQTDKKLTNENHIILWFLNFDFSHEEITKQLNLVPTRTAVKGEAKENVVNIETKSSHRFSFWEYEWKSESNEFVGDSAEAFIKEVIQPRIPEIKVLAEKVDAEFKIVQYYYDGCNPGYHFTVEAMKILTEAGLDIDIDTYCLPSE